VGGDRYETYLADVAEARSPPTLALPHKGGGDHKAFCTTVFLLIQRYWPQAVGNENNLERLHGVVKHSAGSWPDGLYSARRRVSHRRVGIAHRLRPRRLASLGDAHPTKMNHPAPRSV
jgi:hypothetical protein